MRLRRICRVGVPGISGGLCSVPLTQPFSQVDEMRSLQQASHFFLRCDVPSASAQLPDGFFEPCGDFGIVRLRAFRMPGCPFEQFRHGSAAGDSSAVGFVLACWHRSSRCVR